MDSKKFKYELRNKVTDNITGVQYVITARTEYATYVRYGVQPVLTDKDGKAIEDTWLDEDRLDLDVDQSAPRKLHLDAFAPG